MFSIYAKMSTALHLFTVRLFSTSTSVIIGNCCLITSFPLKSLTYLHSYKVPYMSIC